MFVIKKIYCYKLYLFYVYMKLYLIKNFIFLFLLDIKYVKLN